MVETQVPRIVGDVRPDVREFFEAYAAAGDDPATAAGLFGEQFLSLDPAAATPVTRAQLEGALPSRAALFASIGATGTELDELEEHPVDARHTLVRTVWHVRFQDPDATPLTLHSSFLLRREADGWRIAVYVNDADIVAVIRDRRAAV